MRLKALTLTVLNSHCNSTRDVKQVFGYTPDETAFARVWLERETVANALTMVQPALLSYGLGGPPQPALLDVASIQVCRV